MKVIESVNTKILYCTDTIAHSDVYINGFAILFEDLNANTTYTYNVPSFKKLKFDFNKGKKYKITASFNREKASLKGLTSKNFTIKNIRSVEEYK